MPKEHGSWALALEPIALGLLVAFSPGGVWLGLAVCAGFFARRPLKLAWTLPLLDPRRGVAACWTMIFALAACAALVGATSTPMGNEAGRATWSLLWPLLLAAPFGFTFLWFDLRNQMREVEAELAGSIAFALVPAAIATLAGWTAPAALALAALMLTRSVPTVLTVRAYLRLEKGQDAATLPAWMSALAGVLLTAAMVWTGSAPAAAPLLAGLLFVRTAVLLNPLRPRWSARRIGMIEALLGVLYLAGLAAAYPAQ